MKILSVAHKTLRELRREPLLIGLFLGFPVILLGFYYVAFGQTKEGIGSTLDILVMNQDQQSGAPFVDLLRGIEVDDQPVFDVTLVEDRERADILLRERKASLLVVIPPDFGQRLTAASGDPDTAPAAITVIGDAYADSYLFASGVLDDLVREYGRQIMGWQDSAVSLKYDYVTGKKAISDFDFGVGGIIVFGVMFVVVSTAELLVRENVNGTLRRLRLTRLSARDMLLGLTLAQMLLGVIQVPLTFGLAVLMGFESQGSLLLAVLIALLLSLAAVGLGLIVACFAHNDGEAANLASSVLVPMALLSGAMFPMPDATLFRVSGRAIQLYDLMPTAHASEALRQVLVYGKGAGDIAYSLGGLVVLSALYLAVGIVIYQKLQLKRQG
jgi:ABC-2 type transport system permease protein